MSTTLGGTIRGPPNNHESMHFTLVIYQLYGQAEESDSPRCAEERVESRMDQSLDSPSSLTHDIKLVGCLHKAWGAKILKSVTSEKQTCE
jgi:hypothetical protein